MFPNRWTKPPCRKSDVISVTARWGRYERSPSETHETPTGRAATTWHRVPAGGSVEVRTDAQRRVYRLRTEPLREIDEWLAPYRAAWAGRLGALESHLDDMDN